MESPADATLMARSLGYWLAGFVIPMVAGYVLLRLARSPGRRPGTAAVLRICAVLATIFLVYAGYVGGGGRLNLSGLVAIVVVAAWAVVQQVRRRRT